MTSTPPRPPRGVRLPPYLLVLGLIVLHVGALMAEGGTPSIQLQLSPEVWILVAGLLLTIGATMEQLRRMRLDVHSIRGDVVKLTTEIRNDVKSVAEETDRRHEANVTQLTSIDRRLERVETTLTFIDPRARPHS